MIGRALGFAAGLLSLAAAAAAQTPPARGEAFRVTYRSEASAYVSAGRAAGIAVGDRLAVTDGGQTVAELEVAFVAEHSSSSRIVKETRPVKVGDRVVRLGGTRAADTAAASTAPFAPADPVASHTPPARATGRRPLARVTGGASVGWSTFRDATEAGRHVEERMARYGFSFRDVGGHPLELVVRGSNRQSIRDGLRATIVPADERRDRLYESSLAWMPPGRAFSVRAGRLGATPFTTLGYLDGVLGDVRPTASLQLGGFAGRTPDAENVGFDGGAKYGGFVRLAPRGGPLAYDLVLSGVTEHAAGEVSRQYVGQEGHVRAGRFFLHERMEVDLNRGWRQERAGSATRLSEARLLASWRPSAARAVNVSYERRRNFWTAFNRVTAAGVLDERVHQAVRADLDFTRPGGAGLWLGGSVRTREADDRRAYAAHAGVRSPRVLSLAASAEASAYETLYTRGLLATVRGGRDLRGGHRADLSYTFNWYDLRGAGAMRKSHWLRFSAYGHFARQAFFRTDVEYAMGDDLEGTRVLLETGYRF